MAALSAYSLSNLNLFAAHGADTPNPLQLTFHPYDTLTKTFSDQTVQFNNELGLTDSGFPAYTPLSNPMNTVSPKNETWVAFYEKAYAIYKQITNSQLYSVAYSGTGPKKCTPYKLWGPYNPDMPGLNIPGDPLYVLMLLSKRNFNYGSTAFYTQDYVDSSSGATIHGLSYSNNWSNNVSSKIFPVNPGGWVQNPAVAWTYFSATGGGAGRPTTPPTKPPIAYDTELFVANHAYTILGNYWSGSDEYVILRNPFGPPLGLPGYTLPRSDLPAGNDAVWQNPFAWPNVGDQINIGQISQDNPPKPNQPTAGRGKPDGIFALYIGEFLRLFEGIGWVQ